MVNERRGTLDSVSTSYSVGPGCKFQYEERLSQASFNFASVSRSKWDITSNTTHSSFDTVAMSLSEFDSLHRKKLFFLTHCV